MTWSEFKAAVEAAGMKNDTEIMTIDWDTFSPSVVVSIHRTNSGAIAVIKKKERS